MIKFGFFLQRPPQRGNYSSIKDIAVTCEQYGFHSFVINDHLFSFFDSPLAPFLECWTTLAALAVETKSIQLGTHVLCNSYRHPAVLAKMAATLDVISNGRLEFGIGAGWNQLEYQAYGIPFPSFSTRISQLEESLQIIKKMWVEDSPSFQGRHYQINNAISRPKPLQMPHPPITIGTSIAGEQMLQLIAKFASIWNLGNFSSPMEYTHTLQKLQRQCRKLKRNSADIENSVDVSMIVDHNSSRVIKAVNRLTSRQKTRIIAGSPSECAKILLTYVKVGITYFLVHFPEFTSQSLKLVGEEVIPQLLEQSSI